MPLCQAINQSTGNRFNPPRHYFANNVLSLSIIKINDQQDLEIKMKQFIAFVFVVIFSIAVVQGAQPPTGGLMDLGSGSKHKQSAAVRKACAKKNPGFDKFAIDCLMAYINDSNDPCPSACLKTISVMDKDPACRAATFEICPYLKAQAKKNGVKATLAALNSKCPAAEMN